MKRMIALSACLLLAAAPSQDEDRARAVHALNRLAFGARPGDVDRVARMGVDRWIEQQLHPERLPDANVEQRLARYATLGMSDDEVMKEFAQPVFEARRARQAREKEAGDLKVSLDRERIPRERRPRRLVDELTAQRVLRAAESQRQLNEVMVDFWMNHFNVFAGKGLDRFLVASYERDAIRPNVWGRFEDMLMATAKSPAMLFYLDNARSVAAPENRRGRAARRGGGGLNENYARELMELHTLGVDGGYSQKDVTELARVFTGWSISRPREGRMGFVFRAPAHDAAPKTVLGVRFGAGGGIEEGERMIRILARHPATARHVARKLAQRLVADDPPAALVDRVARRFTDSGGDLRATVEAVVTSPEFFDPGYRGAKVKSPFEFVISAVRASGATIDEPSAIARELGTIGEPLYFAQPPTGYSDASETWVNAGALLARLNFALSLAQGRLPGVHVDEAAFAGTPEDIARALTGGSLSPGTRKSIEARGAGPRLVAGLVLGSPEFQKQ